MSTLNRMLIPMAISCMVISSSAQDLNPDVDPVLQIHYLGHSAFVLQFNNDISIVCDYGHYNAWYPGWDSPIYDIGDLIPDVMTYSHTHEDHYDPDRIPNGVQYILQELDSLEINGLSIVPIRVCESNIFNEDNSAYLFTFQGMNFLHLGDAQAQIMNIENVEVQAHIQDIIPDSLDMLFMTIEGIQQFIEEAEIFVDLLKPKRIIPMHYWSNEYKEEFLSYLSEQDSVGNAHYEIVDTLDSKYDLFEEEMATPVKVISLTRSAYSQTTSTEEDSGLPSNNRINQNYPNPFDVSTTISYTITDEYRVQIIIYNALGKEMTTLINEKQVAGNYKIVFYAAEYGSGIYFYKFITEGFCHSKAMLLK